MSPAQAVMKPLVGNAFSNTATNFSTYLAHGSTGNDHATVHDSVGDDTLVATRDYVVIRGADYYAQVNGFAIRAVYALNGGQDEAQAFDDSGTNHFVANGISAFIDDANGTSPPTWRTYMIGFSSVVAVGNAGGVNTLSLGNVAFDFRQLGVWNLV